MKHRYPIDSRQRGVVLAVTLVLLLVVTIIGVTTMSSSGIQTFLARNTALKQASFQNAESTITTAESNLGSGLTICANDPSSCSIDTSPATIASVDDIDWGAISGDGVTTYGNYVVEYLGWRPVAGESDKLVRLYRITGRGLGPNSQAQTIIQSMFRKCVKADGVSCPTS